MKKNEKVKDIKTLDSEIQLVEMENFANNFDKAMKKDVMSRLKKAGLILGPFVFLVGGYFIFNSALLLIIGCSIAAAGSITIATMDFIKDMKKMNKSYYKKPENEQEENTVDQILEEGIGKSKGEDFYTEKYQKVIDRVETKSEQKYREALEKQREMLQPTSYIKLVDNQPQFLDKDETMMQVVKEIDAYSVVYNLSTLIIVDNDWNIYFDILYRVFTEKGIEDRFYNSMSEIGRFTFAKALVNKTNSIQIADLIANLYYLQGGYGNSGMGRDKISEKEILNLQKEIISKIKDPKVINLADYYKK